MACWRLPYQWIFEDGSECRLSWVEREEWKHVDAKSDCQCGTGKVIGDTCRGTFQLDRDTDHMPMPIRTRTMLLVDWRLSEY